MKRSRRAFLWQRAVLTVSLVATTCGFGAATNQTDYARDVDFLLKELPQRAGHFFATKGIDWQAVSNQFRVEVSGVSNDVQHVKFCQRLLARLKDGHARLTDLKVQLPDESRGRRWAGPCVHLLVSGERVFVRQAFGPAAERGVKIGQEVVHIDDLPAREWLARRAEQKADEAGYSTAHQALYAATGDWRIGRVHRSRSSCWRTVTRTRSRWSAEVARISCPSAPSSHRRT